MVGSGWGQVMRKRVRGWSGLLVCNGVLVFNVWVVFDVSLFVKLFLVIGESELRDY